MCDVAVVGHCRLSLTRQLGLESVSSWSLQHLGHLQADSHAAHLALPEHEAQGSPRPPELWNTTRLC